MTKSLDGKSIIVGVRPEALSLGEGGEALDDRFGDAPVQIAALRLQQGLVRGVLDECVPESVGRVGRNAPHLDHVRIGQGQEAHLQVALGRR